MLYTHFVVSGIYLTAALLEIFSSTLLTMTGPAIRDWFQSISTGGSDWFKAGTIPGLGSQDSWAPFVNGWIYAAAALQRSTPYSFRQALTDTDRWVQYSVQAKSMARKRSETSSRPTVSASVSISSQASTSNTTTTSTAPTTNIPPTHTIGDYVEEEDDDEPVKTTHTQPSTPKRAPITSNTTLQALSHDPLQILDQFLNLGPSSSTQQQQHIKSNSASAYNSSYDDENSTVSV